MPSSNPACHAAWTPWCRRIPSCRSRPSSIAKSWPGEWRSSAGAFENFQGDKLVAAILLTRAAVETGAGLWYLSAKLDAALKAEAVGDIDDCLKRLLMGTKIDKDTDMPPINVMKFIDCVEKDVEGFRYRYSLLSEYSHPNYAGTTGRYSKFDPEDLWADFDSNIRGIDSPKRVGVNNLSVALMFFERSYNHISDVMSAFIELCKSKPDETEAAETA